MRARLVAFAVVAALVLAPTELFCELACRSNVRGAAGAEAQAAHTHHHAGADVVGVVLQATSHECDHTGASEFVLATPTKAGTALTLAPVPLPAAGVAEFVTGVLVRFGSPRDRAAPPGVILSSLPHLRL